ncbi:hypothetical protein [Pelagibacterium halotolerans]|uniref:Tail tape measure protein n=1 Tax=Pelagibacterium halotolerans (strain DSM 22347 / JCM 15775 / CGMCC 1.7692 / B2) TaxID=1082931 RepID=G4RDC0_PELHB|nr:hypothetical protein [Pelagibacterium halotolerans]AEQ50746.1 hypothetical protein KKY_707 [Pelagibacterium halotolerans B2]QJR19333.1 hypothetical protein HKM20_13325 [Pelagibacterium halotolerans]SDZ94707.1 hypothetical protein SAMN05428936_101633 [Pelagibacterium halotolerans]
MAERLGEALLDLRTDDKGFGKGVDQAETRAQRLGRSLDNVGKMAIRLGASLAIGAAAGAAALGVLIKRSIDQADAMSKAAQRAGVTTEALSRLAWAGELSDVSLGSLGSSLGRLSYTMGQVQSGADRTGAAVFDALGVTISDAEGRLRSADQVMLDLADRFAQMEDGADKTALAIRLFGRSGTELIPLLNNGRAGLSDMADEADRLGKTISTDTGRAAEQFNDTMTRIGSIIDGVGLKIAEGALPSLNTLAEKLADPAFAENAQTMANWIIGAINATIEAFNLGVAAAQGFADAVAWLNNTSMGELLTGEWSGTPDPEQAVADAMEALRLQLSESRAAQPFSSMRFIGDPHQDMATRSRDALAEAGFGEEFFAPFQAGAAAAVEAANAVEFSFSDLGDALSTSTSTAGITEDAMASLGDELDLLAEDVFDLGEEFGNAFHGLGRTIMDAIRDGGDVAGSVLDGLIDKAYDFGAAWLDNVLNSGFDALGTLLFGGQTAGGNPITGFFSSLFSGFRATGGLIPNGTFGIVGEAGPEPVIGTSRGAMVLPNSSLNMAGAGRTPEFKFSQNITPPPGYETRTREEDTPGGKRQDVWFEEAVAGAIGKPGRAQRAVRSTGRVVRR